MIKKDKHYVSRKLKVFRAVNKLTTESKMNCTISNDEIYVYSDTGKHYRSEDSDRDMLAEISFDNKSKSYFFGENFQLINRDVAAGYIYKTIKHFQRLPVIFSKKDSCLDIKYQDKIRTYPILSENCSVRISNMIFALRSKLDVK